MEGTETDGFKLLGTFLVMIVPSCFIFSFLSGVLFFKMENPLKSIAYEFYGIETQAEFINYSDDLRWYDYTFYIEDEEFECIYKQAKLVDSIEDNELYNGDENPGIHFSVTFCKYFPTWNKPTELMQEGWKFYCLIIIKMIFISIIAFFLVIQIKDSTSWIDKNDLKTS